MIALGMLTALAMLSGPAPAQRSFSELTRLDKELTRMERRLKRLEHQRHQLVGEISIVEADIAATRVRKQEAEEALKLRVRALAKMPSGARFLVLGKSESFADFLRHQRLLRRVAKHDITLRDRFRNEARELEDLREEAAAQHQELEELLVEIRAERDALSLQRAERLQMLQDMLGNRKAANKTAKQHHKARQAMGRMLGQMRPLAPLKHSFKANRGKLPWPTSGSVAVGFGAQIELAHGTLTPHHGLSIHAPAGNPVIAISHGEVAYAGWLDAYGQVVIVDHGQQFHTVYAHLGTTVQEVGASVKPGDVIGRVGDTGSLSGTQLYFEIRKQGRPQDPIPWLRPIAKGK